LARLYLREAKYRVDDRSYTALAFPNEAGGHELRSPTFKGTIGKKDISFLPASSQNFPWILVFEGCFDFLSLLAHEKVERIGRDALVLNSTAMTGRATKFLHDRYNTPESVMWMHFYLDNDEAGYDASEVLVEGMKGWQPELEITDLSSTYVGFKDYSEYWQEMVARQRMDRSRGMSER
jgi:Toprim-like